MLAAEGEAHACSGAFDVLVEERGEAVGLIVPGVLVIADAHQRAVEDTDRGRQHQCSAERPLAQVPRHALAQFRQRGGEIEDMQEFRQLPPFPPAGVVDVLLAAAGVATGRLDVPVRIRADPDVGPGGRNDQALDPRSRLFSDGPALAVEIGEAMPGSAPPQAGLVVEGIFDLGRWRHPL